VLDDDGALALEASGEQDDDAARGDGGALLGRGGDGAAGEGLGGVLGGVEARGLEVRRSKEGRRKREEERR